MLNDVPNNFLKGIYISSSHFVCFRLIHTLSNLRVYNVNNGSSTNFALIFLLSTLKFLNSKINEKDK